MLNSENSGSEMTDSEVTIELIAQAIQYGVLTEYCELVAAEKDFESVQLLKAAEIAYFRRLDDEISIAWTPMPLRARIKLATGKELEGMRQILNISEEKMSAIYGLGDNDN